MNKDLNNQFFREHLKETDGNQLHRQKRKYMLKYWWVDIDNFLIIFLKQISQK